MIKDIPELYVKPEQKLSRKRHVLKCKRINIPTKQSGLSFSNNTKDGKKMNWNQCSSE